MNRGPRALLAGVALLFSWMMLSGWSDDPTRVRIADAAMAAFMALVALGALAPVRMRWALRIVAGVVAAGSVWYFVSELTSLLRGAHQPLALGAPSAVMAGLALLVFGVPGFLFAISGTDAGWAGRRIRNASRPPEHCVIIEFDDPGDMDVVRQLERRLEEVLAESGAGVLDGDEIGGGRIAIYLYGRNADAIMKAVRSTVLAAECLHDCDVILRYGRPGPFTPEVREAIVDGPV